MADSVDSAVAELISDDLEGVFAYADVLGDPPVTSVYGAGILDPSIAY